jgi:hypothetical protein
LWRFDARAISVLLCVWSYFVLRLSVFVVLGFACLMVDILDMIECSVVFRIVAFCGEGN